VELSFGLCFTVGDHVERPRALSLFPSRNGSFSAERRSPRISACGVPTCTPQRKPLCGLAQRKKPLISELET
jgi:hypothetical protein